MPSNQRQIIEQGKFAHSPIEKAFEKQTNIIKELGKKQVEALELLDPEKNQKLKSDFFQKKWEIMKLKNGKIKFNEKI